MSTVSLETTIRLVVAVGAVVAMFQAFHNPLPAVFALAGDWQRVAATRDRHV